MSRVGGMSTRAVLGGLDGRDHAVSLMSGAAKPDQTEPKIQDGVPETLHIRLEAMDLEPSVCTCHALGE